MKKNILFSFLVIWIYALFFIPLPVLAQGDIQSSSQIPELKLQIPIDRITNAGSKKLETSGTTPDPNIHIPVEKLSSFSTDELAEGSGLSNYVATLAAWIIGAISMLAVIAIMIGGIIWLTAAGSTQRVSRAKKIIIDALWGLGLSLGSYIMLSTISQDLVDLRLIAPFAITKVDYESSSLPGDSGNIGSAGSSGGGASSASPSPAASERSTSVASGAVSGSGEWNTSKTVWIPSAFKEGDRADVLYYFHGIIGTGGNCSGKNDTRATMTEGGPAFTVIKNLMASGSIAPIVLVVPDGDPKGKNNTLNNARAEAQIFLKSKKITIASESIAGHSNGGVVVKNSWNAKLKYIGLIDPWAIGITDAMINAKKDRIAYSYNPKNWPGNNYAAQRKRLLEIGTLLRVSVGSTSHCPFVAKHMNGLTKFFKK